ncbi:MAG TPA: type II secretion system protein [Desulfobacteraceae bacterium]|nr:type II secretion system protein [Desulfobacteraceae bacterium]
MLHVPENEKGFTLIEILVSASLFAVLLSLLFGSYRASLGIMEKVGADTEIYDMARVAIDRISEDLESSFLPAVDGGKTGSGRVFGAFEGRDRTLGEYGGDFLRFLSRARVVLDGSGGLPVESEIIYDPREQDDGETLALFRVDTPFGTEVPDEGSGGYILCEKLTGVNFTYHRGDEELDGWDSTDVRMSGRMPHRVTVKLFFKDPAAPETPFIFTTDVVIPEVNRHNGESTP